MPDCPYANGYYPMTPAEFRLAFDNAAHWAAYRDDVPLTHIVVNDDQWSAIRAWTDEEKDAAGFDCANGDAYLVGLQVLFGPDFAILGNAYTGAVLKPTEAK